MNRSLISLQPSVYNWSSGILLVTQGPLHKSMVLGSSGGRAQSRRSVHELRSQTNRSRHWKVNSRRTSTWALHAGLSFPNHWSSQKRKSKFGFRTGAPSGNANWPRKWSTLLLLKVTCFHPTLSITGLIITLTIQWLTLAEFNHLPSQCVIDQCTPIHLINRLVISILRPR